MFYIVQQNLFREEGHAKLINSLDKFNLDYELVDVWPFIEEVEFKTDRKDVFVFGSIKLARLAKKYNWSPGAIITENHDYNIYSKHYKDNLLNYDSLIVKFGDDFDWNSGDRFIRPCLDSKSFTGRVYSKDEWINYRDYMLSDSKPETSLKFDTLIQAAKPKRITQEVRCWVVDGKIITQSLYRRGHFLIHDENVDLDAIEFAQKMVDIFQLANTFVIDVCLTDNGWKIVECGSTSCAGFYAADMQKLIMSIENMN